MLCFPIALFVVGGVSNPLSATTMSKETSIKTETASNPDGSIATDSDLDLDDFADGEIKVLFESLDMDSAPITEKVERALSQSLSQIVSGVESAFGLLQGDNDGDAVQKSKTLSTESAYGHPLSPEEAEKRVPPGGGGLQWYSLLINSDSPFDDDGKLKKGLNPRDFDLQKKTIKPRRESLPILAKNFYSSLTRVEGPNGPRFIFHGILNGWPSLQNFEVLSIERKRQKEFVGPKEILKGHRLWAPMWRSEIQGKQGIDPIIKEKGLIFRITFRGPPWSGKGWSYDSRGFAFWYQAQQKPKPTLTYGAQMIEKMDEQAICTNVHMMAHRYARVKENPKDKLTYHSIVLLEWDHQQYCTVIEAAYLNGLAGWRGRSNFFDDMKEPITQMYTCFPPEMVCPWLTNAAEIRAFDVDAKSLEEFKEYVQKYKGHDKRFVDPRYPFSHPARLTYRSKKNIAQYLVNYIRRDKSYNELKQNCQTLAADLCNLLAGKKDVMPFHPVNRIEYMNRAYLFLYEPEMYEQNEETIQANRLRS